MILKPLNKKGISIGQLIFAILLLGVIISVIVIPIKNNLRDISNLTQNFTPMTNDFSDTFPFIAEDLTITVISNQGTLCSIDTDKKDIKPQEWNCPSGDVIFDSQITYYGTKLRTFHGGILVCEEDDDTCCDKINNPANTVWSQNPCKIIPNDKTLCSSGVYTFTESKTYKVHPIAECVFDSKTGCKVSGMTQSAKSCNSDEYILINVI